MPSLQNGHCSDRRNSQGADVYDEADTDAVSKVEADIEVEREYGIRYGREAGKDNGEGCKSEDGGYEEGWQEESQQKSLFSRCFLLHPLVWVGLGAQVLLYS